MKNRFFDPSELEIVDQSVLLAEDLVNNYFKLSPAQWLKNRYDIKTGEALLSHERVDGPFAQVLKYAGRRRGDFLGSSTYSLYKVCLQDPAILNFVSRSVRISLSPFLLYILVHELVHVVRFLRFEHRYESTSESDVTYEEERKVHELTRKIILPIPMDGVGEVLEFFKDWHRSANGWPGGEIFE
ncbi:MAG TPA: hypothetical protein DHV36_09320 [Desulfobacteraceae bacterium]|nr:hypothetical protein [Desulfobacteraceae bacterium]|tara:strand:- start:344 stop:898 length:555 start_codon:yes stop_codon:yes gene_type:complete